MKNWSQLIVAIIIACLLIVTQGAGIPSIPSIPRDPWGGWRNENGDFMGEWD